jgi:4-hydroxy-tetrahydrodipicolinate synthase
MEKAVMIHVRAGTWPVMLTPFGEDGRVDWSGLDALTDWYVSQGVAGLFAVCLSSEMYALTAEERLSVAARVTRRAGQQLPVVATGTFGGPVDEQAEFARCMADTGVAAVVLVVNQFAAATETETAWRARVEQFLGLIPLIPLGLYECPVPDHRCLSAETLQWAAATGRFIFHKDTVCALDPIIAKLAAVRGTKLRWFNANCPTLLPSLRAGADGYCGIAANFFPELYVWLCQHTASHPEAAQRLQHFLSVADMAVRHKYPTAAKVFLARSGLPIRPLCRTGTAVFGEEELLVLDHLRAAAAEIARGLPR